MINDCSYFNSDGSFPSDEGSSQEVSESLFVGESRNYGFQGGQNKYVGTGGIDLKPLTKNRSRGVNKESLASVGIIMCLNGYRNGGFRAF